MARTLKELAEEAYMVQDASNLSGVCHGMARAVVELRDILGDWSVVDSHPIVKLWADKVAHLTGTQTHDFIALGDAYNEVNRLRKGEAA